MTDDLIEKTTEVPAAETPPPEPVDEDGVPLKNRIAEWKRKAEEAEAREQEKTQLIEQYKQVLGQQRTQPPVQQAQTGETLDDMEKTFDPKTQEYLRTLRKHFDSVARITSERVGYGLMTDVSHTTVLQQDTELLEETKRQMGLLKNNPLWANADERLVRDRAIEGAKAVLNAKRASKAPAPQTPPPGNLPPTQRGAPEPPVEDKQQFLKDWKADPQNVTMFSKFYRGVDINSQEGQKLYNEVAENAWQGTVFTGAVATAARALKIEGGK